jgi:hypothetical protein
MDKEKGKEKEKENWLVTVELPKSLIYYFRLHVPKSGTLVTAVRRKIKAEFGHDRFKLLKSSPLTDIYDGCSGCREGQANQLAHVGPGGCLSEN